MESLVGFWKRLIHQHARLENVSTSICFHLLPNIGFGGGVMKN